MRKMLLLIPAALLMSTTHAQAPPGQCACLPVDGQPAADVLGSEDAWGNPTFIGGITNRGPNSGSVW